MAFLPVVRILIVFHSTGVGGGLFLSCC